MLQLELNAEEVPSPEETAREDKEREGDSQHVAENGPAADMERRTDADTSSLSKDCSITEPKISQVNQESKATDVSADGLS